MPIQRTFTGANTALKLGSSNEINDSQRRMDDLMLNAERIRYGAFRENQDRYLKMSDIPLESYISDANAKTQTELITNYNKIAEGILKKRGNSFENFKPEDWLALQQGRRFLEAEQERMNVDLARFKEMDKMVQSHPELWNGKKWDVTKLKYLNNGRLDDIELPLMGKSISGILATKNIQGHGYSKTVPVPGYPDRVEDIEVNATKEDIVPFIVGTTFSEPQVMQDAKDEFEALDVDKKAALFDPDNPLKQEYAKMGVTNPVLISYAENHWREGEKVNPSTSKFKERGTAGGSGFTVNVGGADLKVTPAVKRTGSVTYGDKTYGESYAFSGNTTLPNLPTEGGIRFKGTSSRALKNGNITGKLKDYIPSEDLIIIEASTGIPELDIETKGLVAIPASKIIGSENLPLMVNGKHTTLGAIRVTKPTQTTVKKKHFNYITGQLEE